MFIEYRLAKNYGASDCETEPAGPVTDGHVSKVEAVGLRAAAAPASDDLQPWLFQVDSREGSQRIEDSTAHDRDDDGDAPLLESCQTTAGGRCHRSYEPRHRISVAGGFGVGTDDSIYDRRP